MSYRLFWCWSDLRFVLRSSLFRVQGRGFASTAPPHNNEPSLLLPPFLSRNNDSNTNLSFSPSSVLQPPFFPGSSLAPIYRRLCHHHLQTPHPVFLNYKLCRWVPMASGKYCPFVPPNHGYVHGSTNSSGLAYNAPLLASSRSQHREYQLTVRQEPKQARMCGVGGKGFYSFSRNSYISLTVLQFLSYYS